MEKYSKQDVANMLMVKGQTSLLNVPAQCRHDNIIKSYDKGSPHKYVCTDCGMPSKNRGAFFKYQNSGKMIH